MIERARGFRGLVALLLTSTLVGGGLAGCSVLPGAPEKTEKTEETTVDYGDAANAVTTAVPRVTSVKDPGRWRNGFGHGFELTLVVDSPEPFTAEELDAVVETIWRSLPWEPNTIQLFAVTGPEQGDEIVDLRAAADAIDDLRMREAGQAGVALTGMKSHYGAWKSPE